MRTPTAGAAGVGLTAARPSREDGFTIIELLVSLTIFGVVIAVALTAMARENAAYQQGLDRMTAVRSIRFAMSTLEMDLQTLGTNVPEGQPELVYAGPDMVAFTADYATNLQADPFAVYRDPDLPLGQVTLPSTPMNLPGTGFAFPQVSYDLQPGIPSPAELLLFFLTPDNFTPEPEDHILWRRVNAGPPERVAGGLFRPAGGQFFAYVRLGRDAGGATGLQEVPTDSLPLIHDATAHLSPADTGQSAVADSVRAVRVSFAAEGGREDDGTVRRVPMSRLIALPNAGLGSRNTCGSPPLLGSALAAAGTTLPSGDPAVRLSWTAAVDEAGGERDVVRYLIWRRAVGSADWGDPYTAIPGGGSPYLWEDTEVESGDLFEYALAAQDCSPALSTLTGSNPVIVP